MDNPTATQGGRSGGLYPFIWRWHFYGGLFTAPVLLMLAATGALYLFKDEIETVVYAPLMRIEAAGEASPPSLQEAAVVARYPGAEVRRYTAPVYEARAAEWTVATPNGERLIVFVEPAGARVLGALSADARLMDIVARLHGELMIGRIGDLIVELAASWAVVLVVTGLFLWWPRRGRNVGVALPRRTATGRALARDWHAVPMAWSAPVLLFLILSGLPWSGFWGESLARLGTVETLAAALGPTPNFSAPPSLPPPAHSDHEDRADLPWAVRPLPPPVSRGSAERIGIDAVIAIAEARGLHVPGLRVLYPAGAGGVFTLSFVPDRAQDQRTVHIDPANGRVLQDIAWSAYSPLGKTVEFGVMTHMGRQFGSPNRWFLLLCCLAIMAAVAFGIAAWWLRRPKGRIGLPPVTPAFRPPRSVYLLAAGLGLLFPLAGASMLLMLVFDRVFTRSGSPPA